MRSLIKQQSNLTQLNIAQIDMAQSSRNSSAAILGINKPIRRQLSLLKFQNAANNAAISITSVVAITAIGFIAL